MPSQEVFPSQERGCYRCDRACDPADRVSSPGAWMLLIDGGLPRTFMTNLLAIDPGNEFSGWVLINQEDYSVLAKGKTPNADLLQMITSENAETQLQYDNCTIEMIKSYGMSVGSTVFETCVWVGRFYEAVRLLSGIESELVYRPVIKLHHCLSPKANDTTVRHSLIDRFAPHTPNGGKGSAKEPGWFHGFSQDIWAAYALAVYYTDITTGNTGNITGNNN